MLVRFIDVRFGLWPINSELLTGLLTMACPGPIHREMNRAGTNCLCGFCCAVDCAAIGVGKYLSTSMASYACHFPVAQSIRSDVPSVGANSSQSTAKTPFETCAFVTTVAC